jgi:hypothetical protein
MSPRLPSRALSAAISLALLACLLTVPSALGGGVGGGCPSARSPRCQPVAGARARAAGAYLTGIGDESARMFASPLYEQLHTGIVRYIAPYDAAVHSYYRQQASAFIRAAEAEHEQVLVAFYHSEYTPMQTPSVAAYQHDVQRFVQLFPNVRQYESWDEANRGYVPGLFTSPTAATAARYYQALLRVCKGCTVIGLDVLDAEKIEPTLTYIAEFKREIHRLETVMPSIWGLHNYADVNHLESWRTHEISRALGGQVWLTETGGIVKFGGAFPNRDGAGLTRAAKVLRFMFALAGSVAQVKRVYIYDWSGGTSSTRFDAGLTNIHGRPRAGYVIVCRQLHAARCGVRIASS